MELILGQVQLQSALLGSLKAQHNCIALALIFFFKYVGMVAENDLELNQHKL